MTIESKDRAALRRVLAQLESWIDWSSGGATNAADRRAINDAATTLAQPDPCAKLADTLQDVTEALDNCLAHAGKPVPLSDRLSREALVLRARALYQKAQS